MVLAILAQAMKGRGSSVKIKNEKKRNPLEPQVLLVILAVGLRFVYMEGNRGHSPTSFLR